MNVLRRRLYTGIEATRLSSQRMVNVTTPLPIAILLGFSATGKSTLKREFEALEVERRIDIRDTDVMIGRDHGGHVFGLFQDLVIGNNRAAALAKIDQIEREFLQAFVPLKPTLVVAGPGVVIRDPDWMGFCGRVKPRGFYLMIDPVGVLDGLKRRHDTEAKVVGQHDAFGSWNDGVTTTYNAATKRWERVDDTIALVNIKANMALNIQRYEAASLPADRFVGGEALRSNTAVRSEVVARIRAHLGVSK